jgi:hypothetical protein
VVIGLSGDRTGPPATRAKALNLYTGAFMRVENPLPRTKSPGLAQLRRFVDLNTAKMSSAGQFATPKYVETPGHDFSRAVKEGKRIGLQPLQWQSCTKCIAHLSMVQGPVKAGLIRLLGREKSAGAKAHVFVDLERHD